MPTSDPVMKKPSAFSRGLASCVIYLSILRGKVKCAKFISCLSTRENFTELLCKLLYPWLSSKVAGRNGHMKTTSAFSIKLMEAVVLLLSPK